MHACRSTLEDPTFGLSFAFGAFVAGAVLGASVYSHQALGDITPLRDLFALLFFASVGMLLDPAFMLGHVGEVLALVALVALGKGAILALVALGFGYRSGVPLAVGLGLFQVGELSFVLARQGLRLGALDANTFTLMLTTAVVTMVLTPAASSAGAPLLAWWRRRRPPVAPPILNAAPGPLDGHVIIAGGGRVGRPLAHAVEAVGAPLVVIELNHGHMEACRADGLPVIYGDAANEVVLHAAGLHNARLLVVTIPSPDVTAAIIAHGRSGRAGLPVVVRADSVEEIRTLHRLGVRDVVLPELEGSLAMVGHVLSHLAVAPDEADTVLAGVRQQLAVALEAET